MAKTKRYWYECVMECDVPYMAPDQRKERWPVKGGIAMQPPEIVHSLRCRPSPGEDARGRKILGDYIVTERPIGRCYTEVFEKKVDRKYFDEVTGLPKGRQMRTKTTKIKFVLLDSEDLTDAIREKAYDFGERWGPNLFEDAMGDVHLPADVAAIASQGARLIGRQAAGTVEAGA